jgi:hypothetical protein
VGNGSRTLSTPAMIRHPNSKWWFVPLGALVNAP